jgi:hypothetical protein
MLQTARLHIRALTACVVVVAVWGRDGSKLAIERTGVSYSQLSLVTSSIFSSLDLSPAGGVRIYVCVYYTVRL